MSSIELTPSQKKILRALTNLHKETEDAIKGRISPNRSTAIRGRSVTRCRVSKRCNL